MEDRSMTRSWKIAALSAAAGAAALTFGLFLAVGKDSIAGDDDAKVKNVQVIRVDDDGFTEIGGKGGYLGVQVVEETKSSEGGARVQHVVEDSPAAKGGLKDGDVIVAFDGTIVRGPAKLTEKIHGTKPGDKVALDVRRDGKTEKLTVEMGERKSFAWRWNGDDYAPMDEDQMKALEESLRGLQERMPEIQERIGKMKIYGPGGHRMLIWGMDKPLLGVEMVETTEELRVAMGGRKDAGVLVGKVLPGSAAEKAGVKVGDLIVSVDGTSVADADDLSQAVQEREGKTVDLDLVRDKKPVRVKATLPPIEDPTDEPTGPRASVWRVPAPDRLAPCAPLPPVDPVDAVAPLPPAPPTPPTPPARTIAWGIAALSV